MTGGDTSRGCCWVEGWSREWWSRCSVLCAAGLGVGVGVDSLAAFVHSELVGVGDGGWHEYINND